ncbi:MAG: FAD-binding oxidoreductase, partial [Candidatus Nitrosotenuis sp.]
LMGMGKEDSKDVDMSANWEFLPKVIDFAIQRVPVLENAKIVRGWSGIRPLTPDINPIIGPVDEVVGFVNDCGWGGEGIMHAPAGGHIVAEYVMGVQATIFTLEPFLLSRFAKQGGAKKIL